MLGPARPLFPSYSTQMLIGDHHDERDTGSYDVPPLGLGRGRHFLRRDPMMDARSERILQDVEPDLVKIIRGTFERRQDFAIVQGKRRLSEEQRLVAKGASTTLHSRHLPDLHGNAAAVDFAWLYLGVPNFAKGQERKRYGDIALTMKAVAFQLDIPLEWGGDWKKFKDWGHIQLPWKEYP